MEIHSFVFKQIIKYNVQFLSIDISYLGFELQNKSNLFHIPPNPHTIGNLIPPNPQQYWSFYSTQFIILVYIIMSARDPNKQPEKLELHARQIAMILDK
jgi:hypothetical protein